MSEALPELDEILSPLVGRFGPYDTTGWIVMSFPAGGPVQLVWFGDENAFATTDLSFAPQLSDGDRDGFQFELFTAAGFDVDDARGTMTMLARHFIDYPVYPDMVVTLERLSFLSRQPKCIEMVHYATGAGSIRLYEIVVREWWGKQSFLGRLWSRA